MSEVIEDYIRAHPGLSESEAFEGFVAQERIRAWVSVDAKRRDRLRAEFASTWSRVAEPVVQVRPQARPAPPMPASAARAAPVSHPMRPDAAPRHLSVMCVQCERTDVWAADGHVACRHCGHVYDDMLQLVPVKHVGAFAYFFGEGHRGWLAAGVLALILLLLYGAIRWV